MRCSYSYELCLIAKESKQGVKILLKPKQNLFLVNVPKDSAYPNNCNAQAHDWVANIATLDNVQELYQI